MRRDEEEGALAQFCRECKERVGWNARVCVACGEENPRGRNPGDTALVRILVSLGACILGLWILRMAATLASTLAASQ